MSHTYGVYYTYEVIWQTQIRPGRGMDKSKDTSHNLEINRFRRKMFERDLGRYASRSEPKGACLDGMNGERKLVQRLKPKYK